VRVHRGTQLAKLLWRDHRAEPLSFEVLVELGEGGCQVGVSIQRVVHEVPTAKCSNSRTERCTST